MEATEKKTTEPPRNGKRFLRTAHGWLFLIDKLLQGSTAKIKVSNLLTDLQAVPTSGCW